MKTPTSIEELEDQLSQPPEELIELMRRADGDFAFLGVGGKMGPTMIRMAARAAQAADSKSRIIGVSRFSNKETRERLHQWGIQTIACDLSSCDSISELPKVANVIYLAGFKFGTADNPSLTWATNCLIPSYVCEHFADSRIVALSSGNVYPMVTPDSGGSVETDEPGPVGEYAMTTLGRERIFQHFSQTLGIPTALLRLNYATELRYGVLIDIAQMVHSGTAIDLTMSHVNVIWLSDANAMTMTAFDHCQSPASIINLAGGEILPVREVAEEMGTILDKTPKFVGEEGTKALLNNGHGGHEKLGQPKISAQQMIEWSAKWVQAGGPSLGKPTHFQESKGSF